MAVAFVNASAPQVDFDNSIDLNMPASIVAGNLLIALLRHSGGFGAAPAGWTVKTTGSNSFTIAYRWATGSETATYTFTAAAFQIFSDARCVQLSGAIGSGDPFDLAPSQNFVNGTASTNLSQTTNTDNAYLLFADAHNNASATTSSAPSGMTTRGGNPTTFHLFDAILAAHGSTGNKSHTTTAGVDHYAALMAIKPKNIQEGTGAATGTSPVTGVGSGILTTTGSAAGTSTAPGVGTGIDKTTGSATGTSAVSGVGSGIDTTTGSAAGASTVTGAAAGISTTVGSAAGTSTASGVGGSTISTTGSAAGASTASGVGGSATVAGTTGTAVGTSVGTGYVGDITESDGSASGSSTVVGIGVVVILTTGSAAGTSTASGLGGSVTETTGSAAGTSTASGAGGTADVTETTGSAAGTSTASGVSGSVAGSVGAAVGVAIVIGIGRAVVDPPPPFTVVSISERERTVTVIGRTRTATVIGRPRTTTIKEAR